MKSYDVQAIRRDFPFLTSRDGITPIYLDNAATAQKPRQMIECVTDAYSSCITNVHRGIYEPAEAMTLAYEQARAAVAQFVHAQSSEIIFTSGATEGCNFIAATWGMQHIKSGDEILITELEHHSNFVVWQRLAQQIGAVLRVLPIDTHGALQLDHLDTLLTSRTKLVACTAVSNALGTVVDVVTIARKAHAVGARVFIDAAQAVGHMPVDVTAWDADFMVFSGHKVYGPTGIGVLYIAERVQSEVEPYQVGGGMVFEAGLEQTRWLKAPHCYEAGSQPTVQALGLQASLEYLSCIGIPQIQEHEAALCARLIEGLQLLPNIRILGPLEALKHEGHLVSFTVKDMHAHDVAAYLSEQGIFVRAGHHCAQPLAKKLGLVATVRVSFACYNTQDEVAMLIEALRALNKRR